jgi:hypothetical protein
MDHPCHKCGYSVEDGRAFCSQCGAPQIRVSTPEPSGLAVAANGQPALSLDAPIDLAGRSVPAFSTGIEWRKAFRACGVAALVAVVVTAVRLMVPPLAVLGAGSLAVILYRGRNQDWKINARSGVQLGALTGLLFSAISAVFAGLTVGLLQAGGQTRQAMLDALQQLATRSHDPQVQAALDLLRTREGMANKLLVGIVILALVSIAVGSIAGALTGAFFGRRNHP